MGLLGLLVLYIVAGLDLVLPDSIGTQWLEGHHLLAWDVDHSETEACWSRFDVEWTVGRRDERQKETRELKIVIDDNWRRLMKGSPMYKIWPMLTVI